MADKLVSVGFTKKTHGAQGELKITVKDEYFEDFVNADVLFMNVQGKPLPFFVENLRDAGDILLKIEDVDSPTEAKHLTSKEIFLREQDVKIFKEEAGVVTFEQLAGYEIYDEKEGLIGEILSVEVLPQQYLAVVNYQEKETYLPLHASLLVSIDEKNKKVTLRLPEGILDLN
ncbi:MAG: 16S rRNA processing protein RimM [Saprospiraceae bacterium]|nr:16S rRNA processing protein RimM [Saprospiraceae bacterium]